MGVHTSLPSMLPQLSALFGSISITTNILTLSDRPHYPRSSHSCLQPCWRPELQHLPKLHLLPNLAWAITSASRFSATFREFITPVAVCIWQLTLFLYSKLRRRSCNTQSQNIYINRKLHGARRSIFFFTNHRTSLSIICSRYHIYNVYTS